MRFPHAANKLGAWGIAWWLLIEQLPPRGTTFVGSCIFEAEAVRRLYGLPAAAVSLEVLSSGLLSGLCLELGVDCSSHVWSLKPILRGFSTDCLAFRQLRVLVQTSPGCTRRPTRAALTNLEVQVSEERHWGARCAFPGP